MLWFSDALVPAKTDNLNIFLNLHPEIKENIAIFRRMTLPTLIFATFKLKRCNDGWDFYRQIAFCSSWKDHFFNG
jgi:hypothetical protein